MLQAAIPAGPPPGPGYVRPRPAFISAAAFVIISRVPLGRPRSRRR